ncbi:galactosyl transferase [Tanacetum coccineum]|uniref:Galactosyl transferase n=1 Tax=Tanacetum coccineum TaxID=301880 RepID=A0ABQ5EER2_9ASTR
MLRRRHAEKVSETYGVLREPSLKDAGNEFGSWRRPFVTHFAGCQPCNGKHNPVFTGEGCRNGMNKALNFADNQVLRNYGGQAEKKFKVEVEAIGKVRHKNLVGLIEFCVEGSKRLVVEMVLGGDGGDDD